MLEEVTYAHDRNRRSRDGVPFIEPKLLHRRAPPPPAFLEHIEFNSKLLSIAEANATGLFREPWLWLKPWKWL